MAGVSDALTALRSFLQEELPAFDERAPEPRTESHREGDQTYGAAPSVVPPAHWRRSVFPTLDLARPSTASAAPSLPAPHRVPSPLPHATESSQMQAISASSMWNDAAPLPEVPSSAAPEPRARSLDRSWIYDANWTRTTLNEEANRWTSRLRSYKPRAASSAPRPRNIPSPTPRAAAPAAPVLQQPDVPRPASQPRASVRRRTPSPPAPVAPVRQQQLRLLKARTASPRVSSPRPVAPSSLPSRPTYSHIMSPPPPVAAVTAVLPTDAVPARVASALIRGLTHVTARAGHIPQLQATVADAALTLTRAHLLLSCARIRAITCSADGDAAQDDDDVATLAARVCALLPIHSCQRILSLASSRTRGRILACVRTYEHVIAWSRSLPRDAAGAARVLLRAANDETLAGLQLEPYAPEEPSMNAEPGEGLTMLHTSFAAAAAADANAAVLLRNTWARLTAWLRMRSHSKALAEARARAVASYDLKRILVAWRLSSLLTAARAEAAAVHGMSALRSHSRMWLRYWQSAARQEGADRFQVGLAQRVDDAWRMSRVWRRLVAACALSRAERVYSDAAEQHGSGRMMARVLHAWGRVAAATRDRRARSSGTTSYAAPTLADTLRGVVSSSRPPVRRAGLQVQPEAATQLALARRLRATAAAVLPYHRTLTGSEAAGIMSLPLSRAVMLALREHTAPFAGAHIPSSRFTLACQSALLGVGPRLRAVAAEFIATRRMTLSHFTLREYSSALPIRRDRLYTALDFPWEPKMPMPMRSEARHADAVGLLYPPSLSQNDHADATAEAAAQHPPVQPFIAQWRRFARRRVILKQHQLAQRDKWLHASLSAWQMQSLRAQQLSHIACIHERALVLKRAMAAMLGAVVRIRGVDAQARTRARARALRAWRHAIYLRTAVRAVAALHLWRRWMVRQNRLATLAATVRERCNVTIQRSCLVQWCAQHARLAALGVVCRRWEAAGALRRTHHIQHVALSSTYDLAVDAVTTWRRWRHSRASTRVRNATADVSCAQRRAARGVRIWRAVCRNQRAATVCASQQRRRHAQDALQAWARVLALRRAARTVMARVSQRAAAASLQAWLRACVRACEVTAAARTALVRSRTAAHLRAWAAITTAAAQARCASLQRAVTQWQTHTRERARIRDAADYTQRRAQERTAIAAVRAWARAAQESADERQQVHNARLGRAGGAWSPFVVPHAVGVPVTSYGASIRGLTPYRTHARM